MAKKTVLITGCSEGGIGAALALAFHERNCHVFATLRNPAKAGDLARDNIEILTLEVTSPESIARCMEVVKERTGGKLDILVNNAGVPFLMPLLDVPIDEAKKLYDTNIWGMLRVTQAFAPLLIEAKGVVLNICSVAGVIPLAWQGIYHSSKAAQTSMSETLRIELEPLGVRVVTGMIGEVRSQIYTKPTFALPSNSQYKSAGDAIANHVTGVHAQFEERDITARNLVEDVLGGQTGQVWRGGRAGTVKYTTWLLPTWLVEYISHRGRGVDQVKP